MMFLADGGNTTLTAQSDALGSLLWTDVGFDASSLQALKATDFEVVDSGPPMDVTYNCTRQQVTQ